MPWIKLSLSILLLGAAAAPAEPPAPPTPVTRPTEPTRQDLDAIRREWSRLSDADPDARAAARDGLMNLTRDDLDALRRVVQERPVLPEQAAALKEIVAHVFLRGESYESDPQAGWLGVRMQPARGGPMIVLPPTEGADVAARTPTPAGVWIFERFPGFVGYRTLEDGDIILAVEAGAFIAIRDTSDFSWVIRQIGPDHEMTLRVLRRGRLMKLTLKLDRSPMREEDALGRGVEPLLARRRAAAEAYWRSAFADLIKPKTG